MTCVPAILIASLLAVLPSAPRAAPVTEAEQLVAQSDLFLQAHPDRHFRLRALDKLDRDDLPGSLEDLREAARHSDKPSQAILAEMYWTGRGVPQDRAMGYVWMDLAAERGYPLMLAKREHYWSALDETGRVAAVTLGPSHYDEYGDAVARPRLEALMKRARGNFRRSRAHSAAVASVNVLVGDRFERISGRLFGDEKFWTPEGYFAWQDELGHGVGEGTVEIGEIEQERAGSKDSTP